jgi:hypothetical protein
MVGVFYPYLEKAGRWEELKYSLRSLDFFFAEEFEVWIVGDLPVWAKNVNYIPHQKQEKVYEPSTFDAVMKMKSYLDNPESPDKFLRMYDDVYFIAVRDLCDLEVVRYLFTYDEIKRGLLKSGSMIWRNQVLRSIELVHKNGFEGLMTETHCPEVFEKEKMNKVISTFDAAENRLLTSTLYYNMFPFSRRLKDRKTERALFYGNANEFSYDTSSVNSPEDMEGKAFINHNDLGLDDQLKKYIREMFPYKCRFEK